jgi:hypothetical protein
VIDSGDSLVYFRWEGRLKVCQVGGNYVTHERPTMFLCFNEVPYEKAIAAHIRNGLYKRGIDVYILTDDPQLGDDWLAIAEAKMRESDVTVMMWTAESPGSGVELEYKVHRAKGYSSERFALILEHGVAKPDGYPDRALHATLDAFPSMRERAGIRQLAMEPKPEEFDALLNRLSAFAWRQAAWLAIFDHTLGPRRGLQLPDLSEDSDEGGTQ